MVYVYNVFSAKVKANTFITSRDPTWPKHQKRVSLYILCPFFYSCHHGVAFFLGGGGGGGEGVIIKIGGGSSRIRTTPLLCLTIEQLIKGGVY